MDEVRRRSSTLSFASCDSGQPSSIEQGYDNTKLQLHAFLEWILSIRWTNRTREHNMADDLFCVYGKMAVHFIVSTIRDESVQ